MPNHHASRFSDDPLYNAREWTVDFFGQTASKEQARRPPAAQCVGNSKRIDRDWRYNIKTDPSRFH